ncbi:MULTISPECIES: DUF4148 domain-containing protein [Caballeronia]|jgi:hypothetical protein|uniref:Lipoprotein n=2 Tax=Caballeronia TaxID=1827195 RepID=A0A158K678_9BURK|nr:MULTISPECIES: DUF4148 domain-containing protein [Caballeronia]SAL76638.1 hypothetical protein AWB66_05453 [Caballeronia telluris]SOE91506.1 protein of unknown function [Caballeronia arationis]
MAIVGARGKHWLIAFASASVLAGCAVREMPPPGRYLTDRECHDLTALKTNASPTMAEHQSELAALRKAGYDPSPFWDDPYYPEDLQAAQRLVDYWFQTECLAARTQ